MLCVLALTKTCRCRALAVYHALAVFSRARAQNATPLSPRLHSDAVEQPLPVAAAANELYIAARAQGHGDADFSAVLQAVMMTQQQQQQQQQQQ